MAVIKACFILLSHFETTDDAQDTKSIDEAKEGECYERVGVVWLS